MRLSLKTQDGRLQKTAEDDAAILVYTNPDDLERRQLVEQFGIDEHTLNSALDPDELPRMEFEPEHIALIIKRPKPHSAQDQYLFKVASFGMFWFKNRLILLANEEVAFFEGKLFTRLKTIDDVALKVVYRSIFHYIDHLKVINMVSDALEDKINISMENRFLISLFTLEKSLVYYLNAISGNGVLFERIRLNANRMGLSVDAAELLDDIIVENNQCYKQAEIYSNILASLMDARASIVGNNLNVLMKTLNIITIGIMVPTFVVSAFSMNVRIPFQDWPYAFYLIMALALLSVGGFLAFWRMKKW